MTAAAMGVAQQVCGRGPDRDVNHACSSGVALSRIIRPSAGP